jgi:hypothetical protein
MHVKQGTNAELVGSNCGTWEFVGYEGIFGVGEPCAVRQLEALTLVKVRIRLPSLPLLRSTIHALGSVLATGIQLVGPSGGV